MTETPATATARPGALTRLWRFFWSPSGSIALGVLLLGGFIAGIVFWGGFNWALEMTNREEFCISCHEMKDNVYAEYKNTPHYQNHSGVRATCPDCHVPKDWQHKIMRKIQASQELWGHFVTQSIWTPEKFQTKRIELAKHEWARMKSTDSRECRNCHAFEFMDFTKQETRAGKRHQFAVDNKMTCIDCHQGIAHRLPQGGKEAYEEMMKQQQRSEAPATELKSYAAALPAK